MRMRMEMGIGMGKKTEWMCKYFVFLRFVVLCLSVEQSSERMNSNGFALCNADARKIGKKNTQNFYYSVKIQLDIFIMCCYWVHFTLFHSIQPALFVQSRLQHRRLYDLIVFVALCFCFVCFFFFKYFFSFFFFHSFFALFISFRLFHSLFVSFHLYTYDIWFTKRFFFNSFTCNPQYRHCIFSISLVCVCVFKIFSHTFIQYQQSTIDSVWWCFRLSIFFFFFHISSHHLWNCVKFLCETRLLAG